MFRLLAVVPLFAASLIVSSSSAYATDCVSVENDKDGISIADDGALEIYKSNMVYTLSNCNPMNDKITKGLGGYDILKIEKKAGCVYLNGYTYGPRKYELGHYRNLFSGAGVKVDIDVDLKSGGKVFVGASEDGSPIDMTVVCK
ncbi:MAG: hypothetical protein EOP06_02965 [Proteobacteria bacterium]|nr:MAG: hypothetical protein EOP06_02965 [Pseudomonadota bacterium]